MYRRLPRLIPPALLLGAALMLAPDAGAQAKDKTRAIELFDQGVALKKEGKLDAACSAFAKSNELDEALGTAIQLAECYEAVGRYHSAWRVWKRAEELARSLKNAENREKYETRARTSAEALPAKFSFLTVVIKNAPPGTVVKRDGTELLESELGQRRPADPGKHEIVVLAPGKKPINRSVDVPAKTGAAAAEATIVIDKFEDLPPATTATTTGLGPSPLPPPPPSFWTGMRVAGTTIGAVGIVGIGAGLGFFLTGAGKQSEANEIKSAAVGSPSTCGGIASRENRDKCEDREAAAKSWKTASYVAFGIGGAAAITGTILILVGAAPTPTKTGIRVVPTGNGFLLEGTWH